MRTRTEGSRGAWMGTPSNSNLGALILSFKTRCDLNLFIRLFFQCLPFFGSFSSPVSRQKLCPHLFTRRSRWRHRSPMGAMARGGPRPRTVGSSASDVVAHCIGRDTGYSDQSLDFHH